MPLCSRVRIVTSAVDAGLEERHIPVIYTDSKTGQKKNGQKTCWAILPGGERSAPSLGAVFHLTFTRVVGNFGNRYFGTEG